MNPKKENLLAWFFLVIGLLYLLNLTAGVIEFIPDNLPLIGNVDEGISGVLLYQGIRILSKNYLGVRL